MANRTLDAAAEFGSLDELIHEDLLRFREWQLATDAEWIILLGAEAAANMVQRELVTIALVEFGRRMRWSIRYFQDQCQHLASRNTVRTEIHNLVDKRLLLVGAIPEDRRVTLVCPRVRLVNWAEEMAPRMRAALQNFFFDGREMWP